MLDVRERAKLSWRCRRGMLELDLMLQNFLQRGLDVLSEDQLQAFNLLLTQTDPELYAWLMEQSVPQNKELSEIVAIVRTYS